MDIRSMLNDVTGKMTQTEQIILLAEAVTALNEACRRFIKSVESNVYCIPVLRQQEIDKSRRQQRFAQL